MSIDLKQFAGSSVSPTDDARLYNFMMSGKTGIVEGVEVTHLGANQLKVSAGWGVCCGRMFEVEEETINAEVSPNGEINGRLIINIDVSADTPATFVTQAAANLPELVQENINGSGTVYQLPVAEYKVDELQCGSIVDVRIILEVVETSIQRLHTVTQTAQITADNAMPKAGGAFTGNVTAAPVSGDTSGIRNIIFYNNDGTAVTDNVVAVKCFDK